MNKTAIDELKERGFVYQISETGLEDIAKKEKIVAYCGFDPTAPSLHLGHVVPIMALAHIQRYGGTPIFLIGGGTAQIGDPSGKQAERVLMSKEEIARNAEKVKNQLSLFLKFDGENPAIILDNAEWLESQKLIEFLRDTGKHFSLGYMIAKESVKSRLDREQGISITEFLYGLLQSYDFMYLYKHYNCKLQIGGSDQWGNITAGIDYIRRTQKEGENQAHGLTFPLLKKSDGSKFGKTEGGAIWLDKEQTSPYEMYQYWINTDDKDVIQFLKLFTYLPLEKIEQLNACMASEPEKREAQSVLAFEFTKMIHGEAEAKTAQTVAQFLFGSGVDVLDEPALSAIVKVVPSIPVQDEKTIEQIDLIDALVQINLVASKSEARKALSQGGVYVNNQRESENRFFTKKDLQHDKAIMLRVGKKKHGALFV